MLGKTSRKMKIEFLKNLTKKRKEIVKNHLNQEETDSGKTSMPSEFLIPHS